MNEFEFLPLVVSILIGLKELTKAKKVAAADCDRSLVYSTV
jgi:hypothetical protein